jgi:hypothetical protein
MKIAIGDEVRVHYHPPGYFRSFVEGVVRRLDVTTTLGRGFVIGITRDVLFGKEQTVKPGYEHYVLYEHPQEFPGRVERVSPAQPDPKPEAEPDLQQATITEPTIELVTEEPSGAMDVSVQDEPQNDRTRGSLIAALFKRQK